MKKLLAVLMALVMLITGMSIGAFAKADVTPVIVVSGVGAKPFYMDKGTENEKMVYPPTVDFGYVIPTAVIGITMSILTGDINVFSQTVADLVSNIFDEFKCNADGDSKYPTVTADLYPLSVDNYDFDYANEVSELEIAGAVAEKIGAENTFFYNHDWRLDPCANADGLQAMIDSVKDATGSDKVVLIPCSMGGVQTVAYLYEYGYDDIDSIIFMSSAHKGLFFVSELFTGSIELSQKNIFNYLELSVGVEDPDADALLTLLLKDMGELAVLSYLFDPLNDFFQAVSNETLWGALREVFGCFPGMWAFVRDEYFEDAVNFMTTEDSSPALLEKINYYHDNVGSRSDEILKEAKDAGVKISIVSHYNRGSVPVSPAANIDGDNLIETACTSNGATVALIGETLGEDYVQAVACGHNHVSIDNKVDASTCLFPDSTWFIKGQPHVGSFYGDDDYNEFADFAVWLATSEAQPTVFANPDYPQFMETDSSLNELNPLAQENEADYGTVIMALLSSAVDYIKNHI